MISRCTPTITQETFFSCYCTPTIRQETFFLCHCTPTIGQETFFSSYCRPTIRQKTFFSCYCTPTIRQETFFSSYCRPTIRQETFFLRYCTPTITPTRRIIHQKIELIRPVFQVESLGRTLLSVVCGGMCFVYQLFQDESQPLNLWTYWQHLLLIPLYTRIPHFLLHFEGELITVKSFK